MKLAQADPYRQRRSVARSIGAADIDAQPVREGRLTSTRVTENYGPLAFVDELAEGPSRSGGSLVATRCRQRQRRGHVDGVELHTRNLCDILQIDLGMPTTQLIGVCRFERPNSAFI